MIDECILEIRESYFKMKNPNYFYNPKNEVKLRKRKHDNYLESEYGYKIRRDNDVR